MLAFSTSAWPRAARPTRCRRPWPTRHGPRSSSSRIRPSLRASLARWPRASMARRSRPTTSSRCCGYSLAPRHGWRDVLRAERVLSLSVQAAHRPVRRSTRYPALDHLLTPREREVLALLVHGEGTTSMARSMGVRLSTIRTHIDSVLIKLGVHSRLEAVAYAVREGIIDVRRQPAVESADAGRRSADNAKPACSSSMITASSARGSRRSSRRSRTSSRWRSATPVRRSVSWRHGSRTW